MNLQIVAVIMSAFNHWEYTRDALASYYSSLDDRYHYILVIIDDCSTDQTQELCTKEAQDRKDVVYLRFKNNGGLTHLWNYGVDHAIKRLHADYIFLANNDILIPPGTLGNLVDCLKANNNAVVGPLTNCPGLNEKTQHIRIFLPDYIPSNKLQDIKTVSQQLIQKPYQAVDEVNGFFWGAHKDVFTTNIFWSWGKSVYYFNPLNRNLGNEREFQRRLRKKGGQAILAANAFIFHYKDISMNRAPAGRISPQWIWRPSS